MNRRDAIKKTGMALGFAATSPLLIHLLQSCDSKSPLNWQPQFFTEKEALLVAAIADQILPRTDTPGAIDVGVDYFIDKMVAEVYSEEEQQQFKSGLKGIEESSKLEKGKVFTDLDNSERYDYLYKLESSLPGLSYNAAPANKPFFLMIKELVLLGYFTSEEIMTKHLEYLPVPSQLIGCQPMDQNQKLRVGNYF